MDRLEPKNFRDLNGAMLLDGYEYLRDEQHRLREQMLEDHDEGGNPNSGPGRCMAMACLRLAADEVVRDFRNELHRRLDYYSAATDPKLAAKP